MTEIYKAHLSKRGFELESKIGSGLSGSTMKGFQKSLKRPVAVKFFDSPFNINNNDLRKKFLRESLLLAEAQHPSIPYVITSGSIKTNNKEEVPYIIMQYISGVTLEQYIKDNKSILLETAINFSAQILDALNFVHEKKIIHRDIKPSNIMVLPSGHCYLIDFSIGFKASEEEGMTRVTRTGDHLGSVKYMSPEQKEDMKNVNRQSDIFSYSLVLCEMLTGKPDIQELSSEKFKYSHILKNVIKKAASYSIEERYSTATEFLRELKQATSAQVAYLETPRKAICPNTKCRDADWSGNGYYRGANFIEESTTIHCTSCGEKLIYQCLNCDNSIDNTRFCGGCGTEQFSIPECEQCGSWLKKGDMSKSTKMDGCQKCREKKEQSKSSLTQAPSAVQQPQLSDFDDIPF
jgi:serine/threonine-protein kinase